MSSRPKGKRPNKSNVAATPPSAGSGESTRPASTSPGDAIAESKSLDPAAPLPQLGPSSSMDAIHGAKLLYETVDVRQAFIDQTAIAMFARGFPLANLWTHCEKLWASREAHLKASKT